ncbi:MAG: exodeoxyribonuclease VII small subunit [Vicinamibacteria bacterium]
MSEQAPEIAPKDFEEALARLENLVKEIEKGELSLENSLSRYEQGIRLARFCNEKLEEAEKRIELLQVTETGEIRRDAAGALRKTPLDFHRDDEESNGE